MASVSLVLGREYIRVEVDQAIMTEKRKRPLGYDRVVTKVVSY